MGNQMLMYPDGEERGDDVCLEREDGDSAAKTCGSKVRQS